MNDSLIRNTGVILCICRVLKQKVLLCSMETLPRILGKFVFQFQGAQAHGMTSSCQPLQWLVHRYNNLNKRRRSPQAQKWRSYFLMANLLFSDYFWQLCCLCLRLRELYLQNEKEMFYISLHKLLNCYIRQKSMAKEGLYQISMPLSNSQHFSCCRPILPWTCLIIRYVSNF